MTNKCRSILRPITTNIGPQNCFLTFFKYCFLVPVLSLCSTSASTQFAELKLPRTSCKTWRRRLTLCAHFFHRSPFIDKLQRFFFCDFPIQIDSLQIANLLFCLVVDNGIDDLALLGKTADRLLQLRLSRQLQELLKYIRGILNKDIVNIPNLAMYYGHTFEALFGKLGLILF